MAEGRKTRSNKGKTRGPYKTRSVVGAATRCVKALLDGSMLFTKSGTPFLKTAAGNRYSCKAELKRKGMNKKPKSAGGKPTTPASKYKKGTVRNGYVVKTMKKPRGTTGRIKVWRKL